MTIENRKYKVADFIYIPLRITPVYTIWRIIDKIIYALIPSLQIIATAGFVDTAIKIFGGMAQRQEIYKYLTMLLLIVAHQYIGHALMKFVRDRMEMRLTEGYRVAVMEKRSKLEYKHIENNDTWELINRIGEDPAKKIYTTFDILLRMIDFVLRIGAILLVLFVQVWWAAVVILVFTIPLLYVAVKSGKEVYEASKEGAKHTRRAAYLGEVLTKRENIEERALFSYTDELNKRWHEKFLLAYKINMKALAKSFVSMKSTSLVTILISGLIISVLLFPLGAGTISVGMFIGFCTAVAGLDQIMSWELGYATREMASSYEYLKDLSEFAQLSETIGGADMPDMEIGKAKEPLCIEFRNVSFAYPETDIKILDNLNMKLYAKRHYAFVGINGAGKTTITKLLTGLYDNFTGDIFIDGKSIRSFTQAELKAMFAVVYQDFARYSVSLKKNIELGNVYGVSEDEITQAAKLLELNGTIEKLPEGMNTHLGKIKENAMDLSGGEWQRVAIARSIVNPAPIRILDEPTAALDPTAESKIYEMFGKISHGKSTLFITHRLGAARLADEIFVIAEGKTAEQGSHEKLMAQNGIYAEMYEAQRSWYA